MFHVMFCSSVKRIFAPSGDGAETPDLAAPKTGRWSLSGVGRESQVAADHNLPFTERARPTTAAVTVYPRVTDSEGRGAVSHALPQGRTLHTRSLSRGRRQWHPVGVGRCQQSSRVWWRKNQRQPQIALTVEPATKNLWGRGPLSPDREPCKGTVDLEAPRGGWPAAHGAAPQTFHRGSEVAPVDAIHARLLLACCRREHSPVGRGAGEPSSTVVFA